ncbi:hypothetical protein AC579_9182 [Pseudocercospora musae]|uniref:Beta-lactamase-related domain-containing protein n=1 Tax=Pseudocercospora musae TaxID=113226 RepID=A0A139I7Q6_9PEZI|nr:hypothetical protein AC579_9182 [Pseudocercospora musae]
MCVLKDVERLLVSADDLNDAGVPSVYMAYLPTPTSDIESLAITNGEENSETVYEACSISKAITALAVAKLIDMEHMSYAMKVVGHVPEEYWKPIMSRWACWSRTDLITQHGFPGYADQPPDIKQVFDGQPPQTHLGCDSWAFWEAKCRTQVLDLPSFKYLWSV